MKMTPEHYAHIAERFESTLGNFPLARAEYESQGKYMRLRWDLLYKSVGSAWVCEHLYPYLNDSTIDTGLRKILGHTADR